MSDLRGRAGQRAPGWYRDPDDPTRFRHWSGRGWSARRRSWPAWDVSVADVVADPALPGGPDSGTDGGPVFDGPVRPAPMPATAVRKGLASDGSLAWLARIDPGTARRPRQGRHGRLPTRVGTGRPVTRPGWGPSRRPLAIFAGLVGMAVALMAVSVGITRPTTAKVGAVATDTAFVGQASTACSSGLQTVHRDASATMTATAASSAQLALSASRDATTAATVAGELHALVPSAAAQTAVTGWLTSWTDYVTDQRQLAGTLRTPAATGSGPDADELEQRVVSDVVQADEFADANDLESCRLGTELSPVGSVVPIP